METILEESTAVQVLDVTIVEAQDKALIDRQIATAKAYPRNVTRATDNSIAIVTLDKETAQVCHYSVPRGGKQISGPSVHLAKIIAQNWGNLRLQARVISIDQKHVTSQAQCFDLESNIAIQIEVKRSIMTKNGRMSDDMITVTGNAANSIALRNAIYSVIPKGVIDKVYNAAKKMIAGDLSDETKLATRRKQVIDQLRDTFEITEKEILSAVGKAAIKYMDADDIVTLIGIGTAIKDGDTTIDEAFRNKKVSDKEPVANDVLTQKEETKPEIQSHPDENPETSTEAKPKSTATISDKLRKQIAVIKDHKQFVTYINGLTHLHELPEFQLLVLDKLKVDFDGDESVFPWIK